ncbi:MAG: hypothetical protein ACJ8H8_10735 [Geminicoccaceae bacterium]
MAATGRQLASPASVPAGAERKLATAPADTPARQGGLGRQNTGPMRLPTVLLPGRWFFAMGRPVPGWVCYALQVSLVGWLPAALWAVSAERRVAQKRRGLAARLRPL